MDGKTATRIGKQASTASFDCLFRPWFNLWTLEIRVVMRQHCGGCSPCRLQNGRFWQRDMLFIGYYTLREVLTGGHKVYSYKAGGC
jgi:hypothetical protein